MENSQNTRFIAKASNLGRLFQILTDVFGEDNLKALSKIEGQEILIRFVKMNESIIIKVINGRIFPLEHKTHTPATAIEFHVEPNEIVPVLNEIIRTPATIFGVLKIVITYVLPRKLKPKGSLRIIIPIMKALMTGKHSMYKKELELE
jgi:hypothetical protein